MFLSGGFESPPHSQDKALTAYAKQSPLHADKRTPSLLCGVRKCDVPSGCPKQICRKTQKSPCGNGEPFVCGVGDWHDEMVFQSLGEVLLTIPQ